MTESELSNRFEKVSVFKALRTLVSHFYLSRQKFYKFVLRFAIHLACKKQNDKNAFKKIKLAISLKKLYTIFNEVVLCQELFCWIVLKTK